MESGGEFGTGDAGLGVEFRITIARIGLAANACDDPLAEVPDEMKNEVANRVGIRVATSPDLIIGESGEAVLNACFLLTEALRSGTYEGLVNCGNVGQIRIAHSDRIGAKGRYQ